VLDWAMANGATSYCHWFQPLGSSVLRHGMSGQVQNRMLEFDKDGKVVWKFNAKHLMRGETDGSSYANGGLRATHQAGGYTCIDPTSPMFIRGDNLFIPAVFVSFNGDCLDEKTPLLRALDALGKESSRFLRLLGFKDDHLSAVSPVIGLEQELFLVPRDAYRTRADLQVSIHGLDGVFSRPLLLYVYMCMYQLAGRSVLGKQPPRGQEAADHYMAPISVVSPSMECLKEIQEECFRVGIPLKTRHREVAPNQYEVVALFGHVTTHVDQNIILSQIIEEVAVKHDLAALLHEKPFQGVNGSGKHNNWSLRTKDGVNILDHHQVFARTNRVEAFPLVMAAVIRAVDLYGDLIRLASAAPGNDFRLGACEAPPAIISMYLGEELTEHLQQFRSECPLRSFQAIA
jgi:glutamine synthetase